MWLLAGAARALLDPGGTWGTATRVVGTLALVAWAAAEIGWGVNPFRRALGTVVLVGMVASLLAWN